MNTENKLTVDKFHAMLDNVLAEEKFPFSHISSKQVEEASNIVNEEATEEDRDLMPREIYLDQKVEISQQLKDGTIKKFTFVIAEIWPRPNNVYTVVNIEKTKSDENLWTMFYDNNCWSLKRGLRGPVNVHVRKIQGE